ncbi:hypothetical protein KEM55_007883 [Ascosphaera atra]|nr:hypothetical protein KEM55_007883 [Ascosphaera atra]
MSKATSFEEVVAVTPLSSHTYGANLDQEWVILAVPHGGYVCSVFHEVARKHMQHTHPKAQNGNSKPMAIHLSYLRRTRVGPATFHVRDMKIGLRTSTLHLTLTQKGKKGEDVEEVVAYITMTNFAEEEGPSYDLPVELLPHGNPPKPPNFERLDEEKGDGNWKLVFPFRTGPDFPSATKQVEYFFPEEDKTAADKGPRLGLAQEWVRFKPYGKPSRWTDTSVCSLVDHFPEILNQFLQGEGPSWFPTVLMNVEFKKSLPEEGVEWLFLQAHVRTLKNGRFDIDVMVLDKDGDVVALSSQLALVLNAARNMAGREVKL